MPLQIADTAKSHLWHSMHIFAIVDYYHIGKVSKESSELDLSNWLVHSTDQNAEYTSATDLHFCCNFHSSQTNHKTASSYYKHRICNHDRMN